MTTISKNSWENKQHNYTVTLSTILRTTFRKKVNTSDARCGNSNRLETIKVPVSWTPDFITWQMEHD